MSEDDTHNWEEEFEDEVQDWKALNSRFASLNLADESIPKRSDKDFDVDHTSVQSYALQEARRQMFLALDHIRGHHEKLFLAGVWIESEEMTLVPHAKGNFFKDMGIPHNFDCKPKLQGCWLTPAETIYLVERGSLLLYLSDTSFENYLVSDEANFDFTSLKQISLSQLYAIAFATDPSLHDKYQVYSLLKRLGYIVRPFGQRLPQQLPISNKDRRKSSFISNVWHTLAFLGHTYRKVIHNHALGSLNFFNYRLMFKEIQYIPARLPLEPCPEKPVASELSLDFEIWKPSTNFRKKDPPPSHYQLCVVNIQEQKFPCFTEIVKLWKQAGIPAAKVQAIPSNNSTAKNRRNVMPEKKKASVLLNLAITYTRVRDAKLKQGSSGRAIVIAAVDNGIVNFSSFGETEFRLTTTDFNKDLSCVMPQTDHGIVHLEETMI